MSAAAVDQILLRCQGAYSEKTLSGYHSDLLQFQHWCTERGVVWLPASPQDVAAFVDDQARRMSIATVKRRVEAIKFAHRMSDLPSPAGHSEVLLAVRRAGRAKRRRPNQALGLTADILERMVAACPDDLAGLRDAAVICVGY
jgi:site-specific recombinase XerD